MKSLILKDLYVLSHGAKSLIFVLLFMAAFMVPAANAEGYIFTAVFVCSMQVISTFSYDEACKWNRYAMVMPISRKGYVAAKFMMLFICVLVGAVLGVIFGTVAGVISGKMTLTVLSVINLLSVAGIMSVLSLVVGALTITLVIKFGAEKGRMMMLLSIIIPVGVGYVGSLLLSRFEVSADAIINVALYGAPLFFLAWLVVLYVISCRIFEKKEFS